VLAWIEQDPEPASQAELQELLQQEEFSELAQRFDSELQFGTAGLRGPLGAGPSRMNTATVRRTTAGFAGYLASQVPGAADAGVVVGHDARHGSAEFAQEAACVLAGAGIRALLLPPKVPTPLLAFAVRRLRCAGGVMITASHNPPQDNGYKVYLSDGAQIVAPVDEEIARCIAEVGPADEIPLGSQGERLGDGIRADYVRAIVSALPERTACSEALRIVYTPLHGVGRDTLLAAFGEAAFAVPQLVAEQADPDPEFSTLVRPNPEEPGTLDLALAQAERQDANLLLANDPDADRLAVAIPTAAGGWRVLNGDEVGALLGRHLLAQCEDPSRVVVISTVASSTLLARMAHEAGVVYRQTLTGFKWIMRAAAEAAPRRLLLGYEEALGYAVSDVVCDKDGISAALVMCQMAMEAAATGTTLEAYLDELAVRFGLHATRQVSIELTGGDGPDEAARIMHVLRENPPRKVGGRAITAAEDLLAGERLPPSDVLVMWLEGAARVVVRPSGTEPKLKAYLQVIVETDRESLPEMRLRAAEELDVLAEQMQRLLTR
jgi:phosphomannomutase